MILIVDGIVMCFVLLLICVIGIANVPIGLDTPDSIIYFEN